MSKMLIKVDCPKLSKFGIKPCDRSMNDLLERAYINVDKYSGPNSHQVCDEVKKVLNVKKTGHSGSLDPKVTGVLLVGLGKATRLMEYMLKSNKEYVCLMYLHDLVDSKKLKSVIKEFVGIIKQTPPIRSAVKRVERKRKIYSIDILEINGQNVLFKVSCEAGTYIRKLCTDIGEKLAVNAQMRELRRIKAGPVREDDNIIGLDKLRNLWELYNEDLDNKNVYEKELRKYIRPMEELVRDFKKVYAINSAIGSIAYGSDLAIPGVAKLDDSINVGDEVAIFSLKDELVAIGIAYLNSENVMKKKKGAFVKTHKIFIDKDVYPKNWKFEK